MASVDVNIINKNGVPTACWHSMYGTYHERPYNIEEHITTFINK